jgi:hypothetical protein
LIFFSFLLPFRSVSWASQACAIWAGQAP